jgi:hypothetical protein
MIAMKFFFFVLTIVWVADSYGWLERKCNPVKEMDECLQTCSCNWCDIGERSFCIGGTETCMLSGGNLTSYSDHPVCIQGVHWNYFMIGMAVGFVSCALAFIIFMVCLIEWEKKKK